MLLKVTDIKWLGGHRLRVRFSDGTFGEHDFTATVASGGQMSEPLHDPTYMSRVFLDRGAPTWPNGYDMAPRWVQMQLEAAGELVQSTEPGPTEADPRSGLRVSE